MIRTVSRNDLSRQVVIVLTILGLFVSRFLKVLTIQLNGFSCLEERRLGAGCYFSFSGGGSSAEVG